MRRLPVYMLIDTSASMKGEPIEALQNGIAMLVSSLSNEPKALETVYLSVITLGDTAQQVVPLTDVLSFQLPELHAGGLRILGAALELLDERIEAEVKKITKDEKGDWKPIIFLFTDGNPSDNWQVAASKIKARDVNIVACLAGFNASKKLYEELTKNLIELKSASSHDIVKFFRWESQKLIDTTISPLEAAAEKKEKQVEQTIFPQSRRLLIYLLIDTLESIDGRVEKINHGITKFISYLKGDPFSLESAYISIISCSENIKQILPLTDVLSFILPQINGSKSSQLKEGINFLSYQIEADFIKGTEDVKGDYNPICFLVTDENIGDDHVIKDIWKDTIENLMNKGHRSDVLVCPLACCENLGEYYHQVLYPWRDEPRSENEWFYQIPTCLDSAQNDKSEISNGNSIDPFLEQETNTTKGNIRTATDSGGNSIEYIDEIIGSSGLMDVYFTADKKYAVSFYKRYADEYTQTAKHRLEDLIEKYSPYNDPDSGEYWKNLFYFPEKIVFDGDRFGYVTRTFANCFFFEAGPFQNKIKEGRWFVNSKLNKLLDNSEKGNWQSYFKICIQISRAVRKMHTMGLSHSDLSYKNTLLDPKGGHAAIIGFDCLVIPGFSPPDILGTPDFIAPEMYKTMHLDVKDKSRKLPCCRTDLHALAVLIYMYLLYRHPLRGSKVHHLDADIDEKLSMGEKAIFVEHPTDKSNRPNETHPASTPWADVDKIPYHVTGPYLKELFDRAFIDGLHNPLRRPTADQWETSLIKTVDLMQPCGNPKCEQKWFVFDNTTKPKCPFCGWKFKGTLPILNFYTARKVGQFNPDNHRLMVYHNQYLFQWHVNKKYFPDEKLTTNDKKPVGYFVFHNNKWLLINQTLPQMKDVSENKDISIGSSVELSDGKQILLSLEEGGKLFYVQLLKV